MSEKLGALWTKKSKKGTTYLSGVINEQRVIVFKVREKRNDKSPDYEVFRSEPASSEPAPAPDEAINDGDIPF
jgi:hypothetical protein